MYFCIPIVQYVMIKDTKDYIIDEAFKLFLNHSYEAVSISVISEAIGLTKGALYHHFKNKEELFKAVIDKHLIISSVEIDINTITLKEYTEASIQQTRKILTTLFSQEEDFVPINYLSLIADCFRHYEGYAKSMLQFFDQEHERINTVIQHAVERGEIRKDIDTRVVALQYFSLSIGLAGDIMRNRSIKIAIQTMGNQLYQLYNLLKL